LYDYRKLALYKRILGGCVIIKCLVFEILTALKKMAVSKFLSNEFRGREPFREGGMLPYYLFGHLKKAQGILISVEMSY